MLVQNMWCNGSHGISVGSLGQYVGEYDIVKNIYVFNASMHNTSASDTQNSEIYTQTLTFRRMVPESRFGQTLLRPPQVTCREAVALAW